MLMDKAALPDFVVEVRRKIKDQHTSAHFQVCVESNRKAVSAINMISPALFLQGVVKPRLSARRFGPISIVDEDFQKEVKKHGRNKTKAAEIEHAVRHHLDVELDDAPELQASFAGALKLIFEEFANLR
jgi:hypothetical protein